MGPVSGLVPLRFQYGPNIYVEDLIAHLGRQLSFVGVSRSFHVCSRVAEFFVTREFLYPMAPIHRSSCFLSFSTAHLISFMSGFEGCIGDHVISLQPTQEQIDRGVIVEWRTPPRVVRQRKTGAIGRRRVDHIWHAILAPIR